MSNFNAIEKPIIEGLQNPEGKTIPVLFYERAVYNEKKSKDQGRPIYENRIYVRKHFDNLTCYDNRAEQVDFDNYPKQYARFVNNKKEKESGVPIGMLPGITPAEVKSCEDMGMFTVEKVSECSGGIADIVGDLKDRAISYLNRGDELEALRKENELLKKELARLRSNKDEPINHSPKRRRRNNVIRASDHDNKQQQQISQAGS